MKNLFSRIMCIVSVLVIMIPVFSLICSAENTQLDIPKLDVDTNDGKYDFVDPKYSSYEGLDSSFQFFKSYSFNTVTSKSGFFNLKQACEDAKLSYYDKGNYVSPVQGKFFNSSNGFTDDNLVDTCYFVNTSSPTVRFARSFACFRENYLKITENLADGAAQKNPENIYYFYYEFKSSIPDDEERIYSELFVSTNNDFSFNVDGDFLTCDSFLYKVSNTVQYDNDGGEYHTFYFQPSAKSLGKSAKIYFDGEISKYIGEDSSYPMYKYVSNYKYLGSFTNADIKNVHYAGDVKTGFETSEIDLSGKIDVKLTPEFGLDMDRVYDENTGAKDYFRFEITNNSDVNIQWLAFIVPENVDTETITTSLTDSESITTTKYDYFNSNWMYLIEEDYYLCSLQNEEKDSIFGKDKIHQIASKMHGVYYYHLLKAGESYSDIVYWENVKIDPFTKYSIRFYAIQNDYDVVSGINANDYLNLKKTHDTVGVDYDDMNLLNWVYEKVFDKGFLDKESNFIVDDSIYKYALDFNKLQKVYDQTFSVIDMPAFTGVVKGGKGVINGGHEDVIKHLQNYETKTPISSNGSTKINNNHVDDPLSNSPDVSLDLDNLSIDNVKSYIKSCGSFFGVLKSALTCFPAFIWVLICFGITALVVIGIVKAIL